MVEEIVIEASIEDKGKRIDSFINEKVEELTRSYLQKLIDDEMIEVEGKTKIKAGNKIKGNEVIIVKIPEPEILDIEPENFPIDIVFEDSYMLIINKNPGVVVHPAPGNYTGTLVNAVLYHIKDLSKINGVIRPGIVHRLDKDTSGLIVIAKTDEAHVKLVDMFKDKTIKKTYLAIVKGIMKNKEGRIETLIGRNPNDRKKMTVVDKNGKIAISNYKVIGEGSKHSLVRVDIETGRTHQIRVHMKHLGYPIEGDKTYLFLDKEAIINLINNGGYKAKARSLCYKKTWNIIKIVAVFLNAIILLIFAYFSFIKDQKDDDWNNKKELKIEK